MPLSSRWPSRVPAGLLRATVAVSFAAAVAAVTWVAAPSSGRAAAAPDVSAPVSPRDIYLRDCAYCHGSDAHGTGRAPTLAGVGPAAIDFWISSGRMPLVEDAARDPATDRVAPLPGVQLFDADAVPRRHAPSYPPATIGALVAYVADLAGGGGEPIPSVDLASASAPEGGELFRLQCAACHAWAGDGGALLRREAPSLHNATAVQVAEATRTGPGTMPAFGTSALDASQLADVVKYVRYLDRPDDRGGWPAWHLGPVAEGGVAFAGLALLVVGLRRIGETGRGEAP